MERAAPWSPIWPCTRWGFPCLRAYAWSGGLLLHLFTLTPLFPRLPNWLQFDGATKLRAQLTHFSFGKSGAVYFLWHYPSGRLTASPPAYIPQCAFLRRLCRLRGIAPFGVRTFLPLEMNRRSDSPPFQNRGQYKGKKCGCKPITDLL